MNKSFNTAIHDEIFLQMQLHKALQRDADGNVIFTIEASNENLDLEEQRVLQDALLRTKDYFLKNGVVSKDHKHRKFNKADGSFEIIEDYVIGEPLDVFTDGTSTLVKGKLYAKNEYAQKFIKLMDQGSSRVRASVGGLIPKVKKVMENGREVGNIVSVLWDDLAFTIQPVNPTVGYAASPLAKSMSSVEFVKTLSVGHGTDSASFSRGRALATEDVEQETIPNAAVIAALVGAIAAGDVTDADDVISFLADYGISNEDARDVAQAVLEKSNLFMEVFPMAKVSTWDEVKNTLKKSVSGKKTEDENEPPEAEGSSTTNDEDEEEDEDDAEDAGPVVKALTEKVAALQETIDAMVKSQVFMLERLEKFDVTQKSIGEGILAIMDRTEAVIASPAPRRGAVTQLEAAMAKAMSGGAAAPATAGTGVAALTSGGVRMKPFTPATIDKAKDILTKAVSDGELDIYTCGKYETQMNKSVGNPNFAFTDDFIAFMQKKVSA